MTESQVQETATEETLGDIAKKALRILSIVIVFIFNLTVDLFNYIKGATPSLVNHFKASYKEAEGAVDSTQKE